MQPNQYIRSPNCELEKNAFIWKAVLKLCEGIKKKERKKKRGKKRWKHSNGEGNEDVKSLICSNYSHN